MGYTIAKISVRMEKGTRIDIDYEEKAEIFFIEYGYGEVKDTCSISMKDLYDLCCNRDKWVEESNKKLIKEYEKDIIRYKQEIKLLNEKNLSLEDDLETTREVISKALGKDLKGSKKEGIEKEVDKGSWV